MSKYLVFIFIINFVSCATSKDSSNGTVNLKIEKKIIKPINLEVFKGKVKFIVFDVNENKGVFDLQCVEEGTQKPLKQTLPFEVRDGKGFIYYAESYFSLAKRHNCFFKEDLILRISVQDYPYASEKLNVPKGKVTLSKKDLNRVIRERKVTKNIYANSAKESFVRVPFIKPLDSFITSHYGKRRIFNNKKKSQHLGNDFRAKVGVPIPVSNRGRVAYVGDLFYTGNVVIIDHGLNLFSLYAHLSKTSVKVGEMVDQGDILGLSGMTGRVSGPHLHWGIKLNGHNVDGFSLVEESKNHFPNLN